MPVVTAGGHRLDYVWVGEGAADAPVVVMLHEGLGSVALWRDFPQAVHAATGLRVLVYSRWGYGQSDPIPQGPRPIDYMNPEGRETLPELLRALGIARPILVGHSDGGSIALINAGSGIGPAPLGVVTMAAHVFVETVSTISIAKARVAYEEADLRAKLGRFHADVDGAFYSWNCTWLLPAFIRGFNIEEDVTRIRCPLMAIQGAQDEYGTVKQLDSIRAKSGGAAEIVLIPDCRHSPHRDQRDATLAAIARHVARATGG
ncbi:MAG: alpha/beta hydrolase [Rhodospirillaceae bacterium]|nr:alpha/beta hydrolase [Rhodospirillaceae bacterium]